MCLCLLCWQALLLLSDTAGLLPKWHSKGLGTGEKGAGSWGTVAGAAPGRGSAGAVSAVQHCGGWPYCRWNYRALMFC
jgi:hypothetical protein